MIEAREEQRSSPTTERTAEETAIRAAVEKHCHCDTRWPATARIDDNNMQAFVTDLRAALADNSAAALTEARAEIERLTELANKRWRETKSMQAALEPFAAFFEKAEAFVEARAKDGGSPILPSTDFRLADFRRARTTLSRIKTGSSCA